MDKHESFDRLISDFKNSEEYIEFDKDPFSKVCEMELFYNYLVSRKIPLAPAENGIKWAEEPKYVYKPAAGDVAIVNLPVRVAFRHSSMIVNDVDEDGNVISYRSGLIMDILERGPIVYDGRDAILLYNTMELNKC